MRVGVEEDSDVGVQLIKVPLDGKGKAIVPQHLVKTFNDSSYAAKADVLSCTS